MNASDDRAAAHAQRLRARRALADADDAITRLNTARERAEALLRRAAGKAPGTDEPDEAPAESAGDALGRRMRQIEDRMQETDTRMRIAENDAIRAEDERREHERRADEHAEDERREDGHRGDDDRGRDATSSPGRRR